jgi:hypothetical protein
MQTSRVVLALDAGAKCDRQDGTARRLGETGHF